MKVFGGKPFPTVCFRPAGLRSRKRAGCPRTVEPSSALSSLHCPRTPSPYSWTDRMPGPGEGVGIMKGRPCLPTSAQVNGGRLSLQLRRKRCWEDEPLSWGKSHVVLNAFSGPKTWSSCRARESRFRGVAVGILTPWRGGSLVTEMERICERKSGEPWWSTCTGSSTWGTFLAENREGSIPFVPKEMLFWWICRGNEDGPAAAVGPSWMKGLISGKPVVALTGSG